MSANNLWLLCSLVETLHHHIGWLKGKQLLLPAAVYTVLRILPDAQALKRNGSGAQGDGSAAASVLLAKVVPFCSDLLREYTSDCQVRPLLWLQVPVVIQCISRRSRDRIDVAYKTDSTHSWLER